MTKAELLRSRAERLAVAPSTDVVQPLELMVFSVGAALYAVPLGIVRGVLTEAVTPVPGVQAWVAGFINVRGEIKSVIDAAVVFERTASLTASSCVLLLETRHGVVGWSLSALPLSGLAGVTGVLLGTIALLDIDKLLESLS